MTFTPEDISDALEQCSFAADTKVCTLLADKSIVSYAIEPFLLSSKVVVVRNGNDGRTYVIFRGTESRGLGTWLITNFQAASTEFYVVDPTLQHVSTKPELQVQGATAKTVAPGRVHQGFLRTWSQLWYGTDILNTTFLNLSTSYVCFLLRYFIVGIFAAIVARYLGWTAQVLDPFFALVGILLIMALESGSLEYLVWKHSPPKKSPISEHVNGIPENRELVFVGHSLGGALATLAFVAYRNGCAARGKKDTARLITFASPLVGDAEFVRDFENRHEDRYLHVMDRADPVTYAPPPAPHTLLSRGPSVLSIYGALILLASTWWLCIYRTFWEGQRPYSNWNEARGKWELGANYNWITLLRHTRASYAERMKKFLRSSEG